VSSRYGRLREVLPVAPGCGLVVEGARLEASVQDAALDRYQEPGTGAIACHIFRPENPPDLERLITSTAVRRDCVPAAQYRRFELDTYHGDALPTELKGEPAEHTRQCG